MSANSLPMIWADGTSALCNHLWQSTLFAGVVWLDPSSCESIRPGRAIGYGWRLSVKPLIPSLLVSLRKLAQLIIHARNQTATFLAIHQISQPFSEVTGLSALLFSMAAPLPASHFLVAPLVLCYRSVVGWFAVLAFWLVQWRCLEVRAYCNASPERAGT